MSKFCGKCGAAILENMSFCPECGEKSDNISNDNNEKIYKAPRKANKKFLTISILVCMVLCFVFFIQGGGYKSVVKDYFSAIENNNAKLMLSIAPEYWKDYQYADETWSEEELIDEMYDFIENSYENYDCGNNIKIEYEITNEYKPTSDEIKSLESVMFGDVSTGLKMVKQVVMQLVPKNKNFKMLSANA